MSQNSNSPNGIKVLGLILLLTCGYFLVKKMMDCPWNLDDGQMEYKHQGMSGMVLDCIQYYYVLLGLENEMDEYAKGEDPNWSGLKPDLEAFELLHDNARAELSIYDFECQTNGYLTTSSKLEFQRIWLEEVFPEGNQTGVAIITKGDHVLNELKDRENKFLGALARVKVQWAVMFTALRGLSVRGMPLGGHSTNQSDQQFDIEAVKELRELLLKLDELSREFNDGKNLDSETRTNYSKSPRLMTRTDEFKALKYVRIPKFYKDNLKKLQFADFVDRFYASKITDRLAETARAMDEKRTEVLAEIEKAVVKNTELYNYMSKINACPYPSF